MPPSNESTPKSSSKKALSSSEKKQWLIENVKSLGVAIILVLIVRSSIIEAFKIPSGSMIPTLLVGDHIFVNKFAYGLKVPFSDFFTNEPVYVIKRDIPKRGDVIVFKYPKDESFYFIKRVIGHPGDRIKVREKILYVNDKPVERVPYTNSAILDTFEGYDKSSLEVYEENKALGTERHFMMVDRNSYMSENFGETTVPPDHLFVMGDNRDYSNDSRLWGFVPMKNVKGRAMVVWLSLWLDFSEGKYYFRPSRVGTVIH